jgi:mRNA deadenylase 3'-5' endonuclease subunit Ccr4
MIPNRINLVQWNVLSKNEKFCNRESFPRASEDDLKWENRVKLFSSIFEKLNADILCLEEVDESDTFPNILGEKYSNLTFIKKNNLQACSLYYDKNRFSLLVSDKHYLPFNDLGDMSGHIFIYAIIKDVLSDQILCLILTHLKARKQNEDIRTSQVKYLMKFIDEDEVFLNRMEQFGCKSLILCGDFNSEPQIACIPYLLNFKFTNNKIFANESFKSAYNISDESKDDFLEMTTFKFRESEYFRVIDYIFYMGNVNYIQTSPTIKKSDSSYTETDLKNKGLPNQDFPSDHFYLNFYFSFS